MKNLNLAIDIGNTRVKIGVFDNDQLIYANTLDSFNLPALKGSLQKWKIRKVALVTVRDIPKDVENYLKASFQYLQLTSATSLPITNRYKTPETLGKDRIAAILGAIQLFPGENNLVIDAGTCITADFIDKDHEYWGGNISPGIDMRIKAMHHFTAKLPLIKKDKLSFFLGDSTETALRNGSQLGAILELERLIELVKEKFGKINTLLTGGDAEFLANNLKTEIFVNQYLVLIGLNKILLHHAQNMD